MSYKKLMTVTENSRHITFFFFFFGGGGGGGKITKEPSMATPLGFPIGTQTSGCRLLHSNQHQINSGYHQWQDSNLELWASY